VALIVYANAIFLEWRRKGMKMSKEISRRSAMKLVGTASVAALGAGMLTPQKANAAEKKPALIFKDAIFDFSARRDDRVMIRCSLDGITASSNPSDFSIELVIRNFVTGEVQSAQGPPTVIR
jgi:hypothetical protein